MMKYQPAAGTTAWASGWWTVRALCASVNQASYGTAHLAPTHSARECRPGFRLMVDCDKVLLCPRGPTSRAGS